MIRHRAWRILLAFLIAPVAAPFVFVFLFSVFVNDVWPGDLLALRLSVLLYAYGAEILFGIPAWLLFRRYRVTSYWAYLVTGTGIGVIVFAIVIGSVSRRTWSELLVFGLPCAAAAAASALTFRIIAAQTTPPAHPRCPGTGA